MDVKSEQEEKKKTVLIVDDDELNRLILEKILGSQYSIVHAVNGQQAYDILEQPNIKVSGVIIDIIMPIMNGFEFLKKIRETETYARLPVIVMTGYGERELERKALELGAWDFISKPFDATIVLYRMNNVIARSQLEAFEKLKYLAEFDELTGIYNKSKFYEKTRIMLDNHKNCQFVFVRADVARFKLINSYYGMAEGDRLLKYIADCLKDFSIGLEPVTYGHITADVFALCTVFSSYDMVDRYVEIATECLKTFELDFDIVPTYGVYIIDDRDIPVNTMYDRATLAAESIKGNYLQNRAFYDDKMEKTIRDEQDVTNEMGNALLNSQFLPYIQPKYDLETDMPCGGEALVRWIHPDKGMISPGRFIPVFEKNGFVSQLDYYMWEQVCILLQKWIGEGKTPYPISVNVSRVNIYNSSLVDILCKLTEKYGVPNRLLQLEITESAYMDNSGLITKTIDDLRKKGFTILMDDFGSGYSSFNVLKDIFVDILKIDMRFFSETDNSGRSESIIASIIRMSKWLDIPVVAEGVEKKQQVEFLRSIGCEYIQGYYFARPMPVEEYETLVFSANTKREKKKNEFDVGSIWSSSSQMEALFIEATEPMIVYEYGENGLEILRVNRAYYTMFGYQNSLVKEKNAFRLVEEEYQELVEKLFINCVETKEVCECIYKRKVLQCEGRYLKLTLRYVTHLGKQHVLFGVLTDLSEQLKREKTMI